MKLLDFIKLDTTPENAHVEIEFNTDDQINKQTINLLEKHAKYITKLTIETKNYSLMNFQQTNLLTAINSLPNLHTIIIGSAKNTHTNSVNIFYNRNFTSSIGEIMQAYKTLDESDYIVKTNNVEHIILNNFDFCPGFYKAFQFLKFFPKLKTFTAPKCDISYDHLLDLFESFNFKDLEMLDLSDNKPLLTYPEVNERNNAYKVYSALKSNTLYEVILKNINNFPKLQTLKLSSLNKNPQLEGYFVFEDEKSIQYTQIEKILKENRIISNGALINPLVNLLNEYNLYLDQLESIKNPCDMVLEQIKLTNSNILNTAEQFKKAAYILIDSKNYNYNIKLGETFEIVYQDEYLAYQTLKQIPKNHKDYLLSLYKLMMLLSAHHDKIYEAAPEKENKEITKISEKVTERDINTITSKTWEAIASYGKEIIININKNKKLIEGTPNSSEIIFLHLEDVITLTECALHSTVTDSAELHNKESCIFYNKIKDLSSEEEFSKLILSTTKEYMKNLKECKGMLLQYNTKTQSEKAKEYTQIQVEEKSNVVQLPKEQSPAPEVTKDKIESPRNKML